MLKVEQLNKRFGQIHAVKDLDLTVEKGELFGFVGHNGAGKTTTLRILAGLISATSGRVLIDGEDALADRKRTKSKVGYMPDFFGVYDNLRVSEYMDFYASMYGIEGADTVHRRHELLELVNLAGKEHAYVDTLSRGMKQRLCLARSLVHDPELLLLDEPASGLDPLARYEMKSILKELRSRGKTILISSHILPELSDMCTTIGIMQKGKMILHGTMEEIELQAIHARPLHIHVLEGLPTAVSVLQEDPKASRIDASEEEIRLEYRGSAQESADLLVRLIHAGVRIESFSKEKGNLENLFLELAREESENEA